MNNEQLEELMAELNRRLLHNDRKYQEHANKKGQVSAIKASYHNGKIVALKGVLEFLEEIQGQ